jgi:hypothetical protein
MARKWQNAGIVALVFPLCAKYPDILPVDINTGQVRGFGSRLHYDFSSETYVMQAQRITDAMARRYGGHPHVAGWQTDNELCCHDNYPLSFSDQLMANASAEEWKPFMRTGHPDPVNWAPHNPRLAQPWRCCLALALFGCAKFQVRMLFLLIPHIP